MTAPTFPVSVRVSEACKILCVSRSTLIRLEKNDPTFPKPRRLTAHLKLFDVAELIAYRDSKAAV